MYGDSTLTSAPNRNIGAVKLGTTLLLLDTHSASLGVSYTVGASEVEGRRQALGSLGRENRRLPV